MRALVWIALAAGCGGGMGGGGDDDDDGREVVRNAGQMCLFAGDPNLPTFSTHQSFLGGQPVFVQITNAVCISSSCSTDVVTSCAITQGSASLGVTSEVSWLDTSAEQGACTPDCGDTGAICESENLGDGSFTFTFDGDTFTLTIPSEFDQPPCIGEGF